MLATDQPTTRSFPAETQEHDVTLTGPVPPQTATIGSDEDMVYCFVLAQDAPDAATAVRLLCQQARSEWLMDIDPRSIDIARVTCLSYRWPSSEDDTYFYDEVMIPCEDDHPDVDSRWWVIRTPKVLPHNDA
jgi:hypothetical protein